MFKKKLVSAPNAAKDETYMEAFDRAYFPSKGQEGDFDPARETRRKTFEARIQRGEKCDQEYDIVRKKLETAFPELHQSKNICLEWNKSILSIYIRGPHMDSYRHFLQIIPGIRVLNLSVESQPVIVAAIDVSRGWDAFATVVNRPTRDIACFRELWSYHNPTPDSSYVTIEWRSPSSLVFNIAPLKRCSDKTVVTTWLSEYLSLTSLATSLEKLHQATVSMPVDASVPKQLGDTCFSVSIEVTTPPDKPLGDILRNLSSQLTEGIRNLSFLGNDLLVTHGAKPFSEVVNGYRLVRFARYLKPPTETAKLSFGQKFTEDQITFLLDLDPFNNDGICCSSSAHRR